jgi:gas vesicle protein
MADGYDRFDESSGGGSFVMGLLTGTVLGAGLGMLFAPRAGSELRNQLSGQAGNLANTASENYRRASEQAGQWVEKGREAYGKAYDKARESVSRGASEADRYVREATGGASGMGTAAAGAAAAGTGSPSASESMRGSGAEHTRGGEPAGSQTNTGTTSGVNRS